MTVLEAEVEVTNRLGLHARAAARFVQLANTFSCRISVFRAEARADGKSILGLLTLAAARGSVLRLTAEGPDGRSAIDALVDLVNERFGESE